ncbi:MAG: 1-acyl-sn-glycerol-3-phosphate acyltransferase [Candidatus Eremiobacteraeota bacterium]|nr:1-acyl-sn-glycerol-3-phosphate acyltransferase [Candidatus Eremiobacteraeota bacterium]MBC5804129.1 1-acyl-sn-glycerol-3-phosphate acyltransferase [Candidatus Eremiobacteraeota bacterium]MBC5821818.1 1-acyl-sn-glycerol-3-phosphate acyltransferase [Candidatus Eremiobacteraeota bacterium]
MSIFALGPRAIAEYVAWRDLHVRVEGADRLPAQGPAILAARHYHHLYDGAALLVALPRTPRFFVALDWTGGPLQRLAMEVACELAEWPVTLRSENAAGPASGAQIRGYARAALTRANALLQRGDVLVVFPEAYPTVDPHGSPKAHDAAFLPFRPGFAAIAARAARGDTRVPVFPVGLAYGAERAKRRAVTIRIGPAHYATTRGSRAEFVAAVEREVHRLSR